MEHIAWLDDEGVPAAELGGKGASLARLQRAGFAVPPGFCVQASSYRHFLRWNGLEEPIARLLAMPDLHQPRVAREAVRALAPHLERARLPDDVTEAIVSACEALRHRVGEQVVMVVRSSALSEDAAAASSAGLYETYLNLRTEDAVLDAVLRCYRSLWSDRAVHYRAFKRIDSAREAMAVVVMPLVPAEVAGVAFTVNPVTGERDRITINASWGLGEAIVSGRVTPDQYLLDKGTLAVLAHDLAHKDVAVLPHPDGASGTVTVAVPQDRARAPALTEAQVRELGALCLRVEAHYGRPVDVEWAFAGDRLYVLQARPVTGLA
jgi:phosphoenolpyruvate synthase/pyruvate phosphate dikinase